MISKHKRSGYPLLAVRCWEEQRLLSVIQDELGADAHVVHAAATGGLRNAATEAVIEPKATFPQAIAYAASHSETTLVLFDTQHIISNAGFYRLLLLHRQQLAAMGSTVVLAATDWQLPPELRHEMPVLDFTLPDRRALANALTEIQAAAAGSGRELPAMDDPERAGLLDAAAGLTVQEAENAFALSLTATGGTGFDADTVRAEKMRLVRASGKLEVSDPVPLADVGGLAKYKEYLTTEVVKHAHDPLLRVRGLMTAGFPGTGKSLAAKATAAVLGWPLVRLDIGALKGSLVGQSEANMREALALAEAVSPCVLWIDEIEKGVGGFASSASSDGGTTLGMVSTLLTWLQEHTKDIVVVATCNDHSKLPPELTRPGRFDEKFYVDLPSTPERHEIATIHLGKLAVPHDALDDLPKQIASLTPSYSGAEIEQVIKSAARRRTGDEVTAADIEAACDRTKPLATTEADALAKVREWGKSVTCANTPEPETSTHRKIKAS